MSGAQISSVHLHKDNKAHETFQKNGESRFVMLL